MEQNKSTVKKLGKSLVQSLNKSLKRTKQMPTNNDQIVDSFDSSVTLPLVGTQLGVWRGEQVSRYHNGFTLAQYVDIQGCIDVALMQRAIGLGLAEVDTIHSKFVQQGEAVMQVLLTDVSLEDVRSPRALAVGFDQALAMMEQDIAKPFSAKDGLLYQHWLIKVADERFLWYQRYHQICVDEASMAAISTRIGEIYTCLVDQKRVPPSPFKGYAGTVGQYQTFVGSPAWQQSRLFWFNYISEFKRLSSLCSTDVGLTGLMDKPTGPITYVDEQMPRMNAPTPLCQTIELEACVVNSLRQLAADSQLKVELLVSSLLFNYFGKIDSRTGSKTNVQDAGEHTNHVAVGFGYVEHLQHEASQIHHLETGPKCHIQPLQLFIEQHDTLVSCAQKLVAELERLKPYSHYDGAQLSSGLASMADFRPLASQIKVNLLERCFDCAGAKGQVKTLVSTPVIDIEFTIMVAEQSISIQIRANPERYSQQALVLHGHRIHFLFAQLHQQPHKKVGDWKLVSVQEQVELAEFAQEADIKGQRADDAQVLVLDKQLNLVPIGVAGQLFLTGKSQHLVEGAQLIENPYVEGDLMYATGDCAHWGFNGQLVSAGNVNSGYIDANCKSA